MGAVAGYKDRMDTFFSYIPGMMSRIGNHIDFPNYSADELVQIAEVMAGQLEYDIEAEAYPVFKNFKNNGDCSVKDLMAITAADFQILVDDIDNADASKVIFS